MRATWCEYGMFNEYPGYWLINNWSVMPSPLVFFLSLPLSLSGGALRSIKSRETAIDFDQNRKPHTKPLRNEVFKQCNFQTPCLDLKHWWYVEHTDYTISHHHSRCYYHHSISTIYGCYSRKTVVSGLGPSRRIHKYPRLNSNRGNWRREIFRSQKALL